MNNTKMVSILVMICLIVVFAIQNAEALEINFLIWSFTLRRAVMLFVVLAIGVVIGWTWRSFARHEKEPPREANH